MNAILYGLSVAIDCRYRIFRTPCIIAADFILIPVLEKTYFYDGSSNLKIWRKKERLKYLMYRKKIANYINFDNRKIILIFNYLLRFLVYMRCTSAIISTSAIFRLHVYTSVCPCIYYDKY